MIHLNAQHERIEFTSEPLENNKLAFLDTEINITEDRGVKIKVYKKPTHTDQYLMYESNHHIGQKLGIISTLRHRVETIVTTEEDRKEEEEGIKNALKECGYPQWALDRKAKDRDNEKEQYRGKVVMPYTKSLSEKIAKVLRKFNIQTIHKPTRKLKSYICNMKEKVHPMDKVGAIYEVVCKKHNDDYTGETDRALKVRGYEHKIITHKDSEKCHSIKDQNKEETEEPMTRRRSSRNIKRRDYKAMDTGKDIIMSEGNTEVSRHMAKYNHDKEDVEIKAITYDTNWFTRGIREAIEIKRRKPTLNADEGRYYLNPIYDNILADTEKKEKRVTEQLTFPLIPEDG